MSAQGSDDGLIVVNMSPASRWFRVAANALIVVGIAIAAVAVDNFLSSQARFPARVVFPVFLTGFGLFWIAGGAYMRVGHRERTWIFSPVAITSVSRNRPDVTLRWDEIERVRVHQIGGFRFVGAGKTINLGEELLWERRKEEFQRVLEIVRRHFDVPDRRGSALAAFAVMNIVLLLMVAVLYASYRLVMHVVTELLGGRPPWALVLLRLLFLALDRDADAFGLVLHCAGLAFLFGPSLLLVAILCWSQIRSGWHERLPRESGTDRAAGNPGSPVDDRRERTSSERWSAL